MTHAAVETATGSAEAATRMLERLADQLGGRASVTAVFGEPVTCEGVTVIPVARAGFGFGGGAGRENSAAKTGEGGGGGGGAEVRPVGFIEIRIGTAVYRPIRDPWADIIVPLVALLAATTAPRLVRTIARRRNRKTWTGPRPAASTGSAGPLHRHASRSRPTSARRIDSI
ncbi:sporulation protein [Streptomyces sp. ISL-99]|nr:sporulation protein [Streptomyces sp. ISL-99]